MSMAEGMSQFVSEGESLAVLLQRLIWIAQKPQNPHQIA
jgi:hypothetical protein